MKVSAPPRLRTAFWWLGRPNFGDLLAPLLLRKLAGLDLEWAPPEDAQVVAVGSVLDLLPPGWAGTVIGAGKLHEGSVVDLRAATVLALRGRLSAAGVAGDYALGDPGLLCSEIVPTPTAKRYDLCVVPHWSDTDGVLAKRFAHLEPHVVDSSHDPLTVIEEIAASKKVVASSLHGVIVADAYRIPRRVERFPRIDHRWEGGTFKYDDYASALDGPMEFGVLGTPDPAAVDRAQAELFDAFQALVGS